jgi:hypothetical protein
MTMSTAHPLRRSIGLLVLAILLALAVNSFARGGDVVFRAAPREGFVGVPAVLQLEIRDASDFTPPELPTVDGLEIALGAGQHKSTNVTIINGKAKQSTTQLLEIEFTPTREGRFTVPAFEVVVDGATFTSKPFTLVAKPSDTGDILLAEIAADPPNPYVGQPTKLTLRIWFKPFRDPTKNVELDGGNMWSLLDIERTEWGPFRNAITQMERRRQRPTDRDRMKGDVTYTVFEIEDTWTPTQAGTADFSAVEIKGSWPTGVQIVRNFFGQNQAQLSGTRPVMAKANAGELTVRPLPSEGRPQSFAGAVGDFTVTATARPTDVAVGDPITIVYTVKAQGRDPRSLGSLETLQAPPFASLPNLTKDFRIPSDQLGGTVRDREKTFTQTFRPLNESITAVPPLPFSFFDPEAGTYREILTEAIPITVRAAERMNLSQIVGGEDARTPQSNALTAVAGGLLANVPPNESLTHSSRTSIGAAVAGAVALPPLLCSVLFLARRVQQARDADPLRRRAARAAATAHVTLTATPTPETILAAVTGYIADRRGLGDGARTRGDAVAALREAGVDEELIARTDGFLAACERSRYAPSGASGPSAAEAKAIIALCERSPLATRASSAATRSNAGGTNA